MRNLVDPATLAVGLWGIQVQSLQGASKIALCAEEAVVAWGGSRSPPSNGQTTFYSVLNTSSISSI
jgi:hypothetical protein